MRYSDEGFKSIYRQGLAAVFGSSLETKQRDGFVSSMHNIIAANKGGTELEASLVVPAVLDFYALLHEDVWYQENFNEEKVLGLVSAVVADRTSQFYQNSSFYRRGNIFTALAAYALHFNHLQVLELLINSRLSELDELTQEQLVEFLNTELIAKINCLSEVILLLNNMKAQLEHEPNEARQNFIAQSFAAINRILARINDDQRKKMLEHELARLSGMAKLGLNDSGDLKQYLSFYSADVLRQVFTRYLHTGDFMDAEFRAKSKGALNLSVELVGLVDSLKNPCNPEDLVAFQKIAFERFVKFGQHLDGYRTNPAANSAVVTKELLILYKEFGAVLDDLALAKLCSRYRDLFITTGHTLLNPFAPINQDGKNGLRIAEIAMIHGHIETLSFMLELDVQYLAKLPIEALAAHFTEKTYLLASLLTDGLVLVSLLYSNKICSSVLTSAKKEHELKRIKLIIGDLNKLLARFSGDLKCQIFDYEYENLIRLQELELVNVTPALQVLVLLGCGTALQEKITSLCAANTGDYEVSHIRTTLDLDEALSETEPLPIEIVAVPVTGVKESRGDTPESKQRDRFKYSAYMSTHDEADLKESLVRDVEGFIRTELMAASEYADLDSASPQLAIKITEWLLYLYPWIDDAKLSAWFGESDILKILEIILENTRYFDSQLETSAKHYRLIDYALQYRHVAVLKRLIRYELDMLQLLNNEDLLSYLVKKTSSGLSSLSDFLLVMNCLYEQAEKNDDNEDELDCLATITKSLITLLKKLDFSSYAGVCASAYQLMNEYELQTGRSSLAAEVILNYICNNLGFGLITNTSESPSRLEKMNAVQRNMLLVLDFNERLAPLQKALRTALVAADKEALSIFMRNHSQDHEVVIEKELMHVITLANVDRFKLLVGAMKESERLDIILRSHPGKKVSLFDYLICMTSSKYREVSNKKVRRILSESQLKAEESVIQEMVDIIIESYGGICARYHFYSQKLTESLSAHASNKDKGVAESLIYGLWMATVNVVDKYLGNTGDRISRNFVLSPKVEAIAEDRVVAQNFVAKIWIYYLLLKRFKEKIDVAGFNLEKINFFIDHVLSNPKKFPQMHALLKDGVEQESGFYPGLQQVLHSRYFAKKQKEKYSELDHLGIEFSDEPTDLKTLYKTLSEMLSAKKAPSDDSMKKLLSAVDVALNNDRRKLIYAQSDVIAKLFELIHVSANPLRVKLLENTLFDYLMSRLSLETILIRMSDESTAEMLTRYLGKPEELYATLKIWVQRNEPTPILFKSLVTLAYYALAHKSKENSLKLCRPLVDFLSWCFFVCLEEVSPIDLHKYSGLLEELVCYGFFHDKFGDEFADLFVANAELYQRWHREKLPVKAVAIVKDVGVNGKDSGLLVNPQTQAKSPAIANSLKLGKKLRTVSATDFYKRRDLAQGETNAPLENLSKVMIKQPEKIVSAVIAAIPSNSAALTSAAAESVQKELSKKTELGAKVVKMKQQRVEKSARSLQKFELVSAVAETAHSVNKLLASSASTSLTMSSPLYVEADHWLVESESESKAQLKALIARFTEQKEVLYTSLLGMYFELEHDPLSRQRADVSRLLAIMADSNQYIQDLIGLPEDAPIDYRQSIRALVLVPKDRPVHQESFSYQNYVNAEHAWNCLLNNYCQSLRDMMASLSAALHEKSCALLVRLQSFYARAIHDSYLETLRFLFAEQFIVEVVGSVLTLPDPLDMDVRMICLDSARSIQEILRYVVEKFTLYSIRLDKNLRDGSDFIHLADDEKSCTLRVWIDAMPVDIVLCVFSAFHTETEFPNGQESYNLRARDGLTRKDNLSCGVACGDGRLIYPHEAMHGFLNRQYRLFAGVSYKIEQLSFALKNIIRAYSFGYKLVDDSQEMIELLKAYKANFSGLMKESRVLAIAINKLLTKHFSITTEFKWLAQESVRFKFRSRKYLEFLQQFGFRILVSTDKSTYFEYRLVGTDVQAVAFTDSIDESCIKVDIELLASSATSQPSMAAAEYFPAPSVGVNTNGFWHQAGMRLPMPSSIPSEPTDQLTGPAL